MVHRHYLRCVFIALNVQPVSYTHLDVYKRQAIARMMMVCIYHMVSEKKPFTLSLIHISGEKYQAGDLCLTVH